MRDKNFVILILLKNKYENSDLQNINPIMLIQAMASYFCDFTNLSENDDFV